jgi:hypothetical protein
VGKWLYIPNLTVGLSTNCKKKVLQANEQEQAPTVQSCLLEGNFFKKQKFTGLSH